MNFCKYHGARPQNTVRRGPDHPAFKHGLETLEAKAERSKKLAELRELEALSFALGLAVGPKWRGRKPLEVLLRLCGDQSFATADISGPKS